ncbi:Cytochrome c oxidase assembly protein COX18, mitochondrial [Anthophora quadrimaculata]
MTVQMLTKFVFNIKCDTNSFHKCFHSIHYISNVSSQNIHKKLLSNNKVLVGYFSSKRNFSKRTQNVSSQQQIVTHKMLKGLLLYNKETVLAKKVPINHLSAAANNVRQYSNSAPVIITEAVKYNSGIFQMLSESICVAWITDALRLVHYEVGLPWWATIIFSTIIARTLIHLPLTILDHHTRAKRENLQPELKQIAERIKMEVRMEIATNQISPARAVLLFTRAFNQEQRELHQRENCHPFKSVATLLLQAPVWISYSVAVRNMAYILPERNPVTFQDYFGLTHGGFGWIQDLTAVDHLFVLPVFFTLTGLALIEINQVLYNVDKSRFRNILTNFSRIVVICFLPLTACIPSSLTLYWVTNNCCSLLQSMLLLSPKFRRIVRIPKTDSELQHPYAELYKRLLGMFRLKGSVAKA